MRNEAISGRLREIADILEMEEVEYKPRAYRKAARRIESLNEDVEDIHERGSPRTSMGSASRSNRRSSSSWRPARWATIRT